MGGEIAAAIIGGAATIGTQAYNTASTGKMNRKTRAHDLYKFDRAREYALSDWHMQNEYNSPKATMSRLKEAGLNPALVYGHGATASNAVMPRNADSGSLPTHAPQIDAGAVKDTIGNFYAAKTMKLQESILQQNLRNEEQRESQIRAQTIDSLSSARNKDIHTDRGEFDLAMENELRDFTLSKRRSETHIAAHQERSHQFGASTAELEFMNLPTKISQENALRHWNSQEIQSRVTEINQRVDQRGKLFPGELKAQYQAFYNAMRQGDLHDVELQLKQIERYMHNHNMHNQEDQEMFNNLKSLVPTFFMPLRGSGPAPKSLSPRASQQKAWSPGIRNYKRK